MNQTGICKTNTWLTTTGSPQKTRVKEHKGHFNFEGKNFVISITKSNFHRQRSPSTILPCKLQIFCDRYCYQECCNRVLYSDMFFRKSLLLGVRIANSNNDLLQKYGRVSKLEILRKKITTKPEKCTEENRFHMGHKICVQFLLQVL